MCLPLRGDTADQVIRAQDKHLNEIVSSGDESHKSALKEMKGRWKHPLSGMAWYRKATRDFAALLDLPPLGSGGASSRPHGVRTGQRRLDAFPTDRAPFAYVNASFIVLKGRSAMERAGRPHPGAQR
jgi:hypothetical protein